MKPFFYKKLKNGKVQYYTKEKVQEQIFEDKVENGISIRQYEESKNKYDELDVTPEELEKAFSKKEHYKAMKKLTKKEKEILYYLIVIGLTARETAEILNTSPDSVSSIKRRAIIHFKENLKKEMKKDAK